MYVPTNFSFFFVLIFSYRELRNVFLSTFSPFFGSKFKRDFRKKFCNDEIKTNGFQNSSYVNRVERTTLFVRNSTCSILGATEIPKRKLWAWFDEFFIPNTFNSSTLKMQLQSAFNWFSRKNAILLNKRCTYVKFEKIIIQWGNARNAQLQYQTSFKVKHFFTETTSMMRISFYITP